MQFNQILKEMIIVSAQQWVRTGRFDEKEEDD